VAKSPKADPSRSASLIGPDKDCSSQMHSEQKMDIRTATREASLMRVRRIMMTVLMACLGLLRGGSLCGHRIRHIKTLCHRYRCRISLAAIPWLFCEYRALPDCCLGGRRAESVGGACSFGTPCGHKFMPAELRGCPIKTPFAGTVDSDSGNPRA